MKRIIVMLIALALIGGCKSKKEFTQKTETKEVTADQMAKQEMQESSKAEKAMPDKVGNTQIVEEKDAPKEREMAEPPRANVEGMASDGGQEGPAHKGEEPRLVLLAKKSPTEINEMADDYYTINNVSVYETQIIVELNYSGGCGGANFQAVWNGALMKSMPPKANVSLLLDDKDDCEALVSEKVYIDVSPLLKEVGENGVFVRLKGWGIPLDFTPKK